MPTVRKQLSMYFRALSRRKQPRVRFILFAQGRSGSTLLGELIGSHPEVTWADEILSSRVLAPRLWVDGYSRREGSAAFGFKAKIYQLVNDQHIKDPGAWMRRAYGEGWQVLYLWRRDVVRQVLSNIVRDARGRSHDREGMVDVVTRVHVDPDTLIEYCSVRELTRREEQAAIAGIPHASFAYEDDLLDPAVWQPTADRAFRHLGLEPASVTTNLRRINAAPLERIIENYGEVQRALASTPYAMHLDQPDA